MGTKATAALEQPVRGVRDLRQRFLRVSKRTRQGKLQMSLVDEPDGDDLAEIPEGETLIVGTPSDWLLLHSGNSRELRNIKVFSVDRGTANGLIVVIGRAYWAVAGRVVQAPPSVKDLRVSFDHAVGHLIVDYEFVSGEEGRSTIEWIKLEPNRPQTIVALGKCHAVTASDRDCIYRVIVTPVTVDGRKGSPVSYEPVEIRDSYIRLEDDNVTLTPPDSVIEGVGCFVTWRGPGGSPPKSGAFTLIELSKPPLKRQRLFWISLGKVIAEGQRYMPRKIDIGKVFMVELRDRIRGTTIASCQLPAFEGHPPLVRDVKLHVESKAMHRITVTGNYFGGIEGNSEIKWFAQRSTSDKRQQIENNSPTRKWIDLDSSYDSATIVAEYLPVNDVGESGQSSESEPVVLPTIAFIKIVSHEFVLTGNYTKLLCRLSTVGPGRVSYCWGYYIEGELQETDETSDTHVIHENDLQVPLACIVRTFGPEGDRGEESIIDVVPSVEERLTPVIRSVRLHQGDRPLPSESPLVVRQEYRVVIECTGPTIIRQEVVWQRSTPNQTWETAGRGPFYRTMATDLNKCIRATCKVIAETSVIHELTSEEFEGDPHEVLGDNPLLRRLASTMKRFRRAHFDAAFVTGAAVAVVMEIQREKPQLLIQKGMSVLFKSNIHDVEIEAIDDSENGVSLTGRHGYRTELAIGHKKMNGGIEFEPAQARNLFMEAFEAFRANPERKRT
jgi:hypothetical protein